MTTDPNRFVVGPDPDGRSAVLQRGLTNVQSHEGFFWRATLWRPRKPPSTTPSKATGRRPLVWAHNANPSPTD